MASHSLIFCLRQLGKDLWQVIASNSFDIIHHWKWWKSLGGAGILFSPIDYRYVWADIGILQLSSLTSTCITRSSSIGECQVVRYQMLSMATNTPRSWPPGAWNPGRQHQASPSDVMCYIKAYAQGTWGTREEAPHPARECKGRFPQELECHHSRASQRAES